MRTRFNYWSCSKFADLVRGEKKPHALELGKWEEWRREVSKRRPVRYWLAEDGLRRLQNLFMFPSDVCHSISYYIRNRWIDKTHVLKTGLKPGAYHELDHRILHGLFNELVIFVEVELAHLSKWDQKKKYKFKNGRCVEAAYDYFEWAGKLKEKNENGRMALSRQAKTTRQIRKLYEWWKFERPGRIDPSDLAEGKNYRKILDAEEKYHDEDEEMLVELVKLRRHLWT
jgi:hypothetical protein